MMKMMTAVMRRRRRKRVRVAFISVGMKWTGFLYDA
jgi:hypothetical protein